jgi:hypothetical protein
MWEATTSIYTFYISKLAPALPQHPWLYTSLEDLESRHLGLLWMGRTVSTDFQQSFSTSDQCPGPCYVNIHGNGTVKSRWSFNEHANVMYIDQPVQTGPRIWIFEGRALQLTVGNLGFSYDSLINATYDGLVVTPLKPGEPLPKHPKRAGLSVFSSQKYSHTATTTPQAAKTLWYSAENWLSSFPGYYTTSKKIAIWVCC